MTNSKPAKILVIDDDPNTVRFIQKWCENAGKDVVGVFNAQTGIETARQDPPDLILLDMMLPDGNGVAVARALKQDPATVDVPVIFITVTMGVENDRGDETIDVDGCLYRIFAKPLHPQKLLAEIRKSINRRRHGNPSDIKGS